MLHRFNRTGQTLLNTGVNMLDMLAIASEAVNNSVISAEINRAADKAKGGKELSVSLQPEPHIPHEVAKMHWVLVKIRANR